MSDDRGPAARELSARLAQLRATTRSPDGLTTVTVGGSGDLIDLALDERIRQRLASDTAHEILRIWGAARRTLAAAATTLTEETIGADSAAGRAIIASYRGRLGEPDI